MNFLYEVPNSIGAYSPLSYYIGIKIGYFLGGGLEIALLWPMLIPVP